MEKCFLPFKADKSDAKGTNIHDQQREIDNLNVLVLKKKAVYTYIGNCVHLHS